MSPAVGKRTRDAEASQALNPFRRKLRRSASTKFGSQSDALWAGITAPSFERQADEDEWTENTPAKQQSTRASTRTHTPVSPHRDASALAHDVLVEPKPRDPADAQELALPPQPDDDSGYNGIFQGRLVCPHGFDAEKTSILRQHLESNGAHVITAIELNKFPLDQLRKGYVVIPHDAEIDLTALPDHAGSHVSFVTNWWVERCLYGKRLVDPADDVLSRPFERLSISGFSGLTINSTGFSGIELLHVTKVVMLMGATYDEQLSAKTSVVICNPPTVNTPKLKFATDKRIPAVHVTWLWECLRSGRLQPYAEYQLNKTTQPPPQDPKPRPQPPANVTAEPLSGGSSKLRDKAQASTIVSKPPQQQLPQRPGVLNLTPSADATPKATTENPARTSNDTHNVNHDGNGPGIAGYDGGASHPHQDTNADRTRRPSVSSNHSNPFSRPRSSSAESLIAPVPRKSKHARETATEPLGPEPGSGPVIPPDTEPSVAQGLSKLKEPEEEKDYSSILAQLRANRKTAPGPSDQATSKTRQRRQLGRATSTRSNVSAGDSSGDILAHGDDENTIVLEEHQPSQTLGWDSPGAAKAREQMIRKLGGTVQDKSVPVEGIGVVRDVGGEELTGRAARKRR